MSPRKTDSTRHVGDSDDTGDTGDTDDKRRSTAFVDEVGEGSLRILLGDAVLSLPRVLAPSGVTEGGWIEIEITRVPVPAQHAGTPALRHALGKDDDGGDFGL